MVVKKYTLLLAFVFSTIGTVLYSQNSDVSTTWKDSSKVSTKNRAQFGEFARNNYIYPARPKDMWEVGVGIGAVTLGGDLNNDVGWGATITARKSLSHVFSLRPYLSYYAVNGKSEFPDPNARDFKTKSWGLGLDGIASLNTIRSYKGNPRFEFYALVGFGLVTANVQKKNAAGDYVQFYNTMNPNGPITTIGEKQGGVGATAVILGFNVGGGIAFKINDRFNLGFESKNTLTNYDYLDGFQGISSNAYDALWFHTIRGNFNIGKKEKRVEPLWWINPNNYVYNELNAPEHLKNKLKVKLDDADGDGITDQFDMEPNTPAGVAVDSRGRALDTDGDGVPDYKDKELLTRQECFPVNADGVGTCPESPCCKESREKITELQKVIETLKGGPNGEGGIGGSCGLNNLPSIAFKSGDNKLSRDNMKLLDAVAEQMKNNPSCRVKVLGHPESSKASQQKAYDRVESIIKYLVDKKGISENRFIFSYDAGSGDGNTIDLQGTTEEGPSTVPAPAPHLKGKH